MSIDTIISLLKFIAFQFYGPTIFERLVYSKFPKSTYRKLKLYASCHVVSVLYLFSLSMSNHPNICN